MVSLDFDHPVFDGTAGAALLFEHFGKFFEFRLAHSQPGYQADAATLAALGLPAYPYQAVTLR